MYTLFLYFSFFEPVFVISWSFSLRNEFHSFDLFYLPLLSSSRSKFSTFWSFSIRFCLCRLFLSIVIQSDELLFWVKVFSSVVGTTLLMELSLVFSWLDLQTLAKWFSFFDLLIVFNSVLLVSLVLIHSNTVKSCFQACVFSSPKILYFFSKRKAVMPFQVWFRYHNGRFSI